MRFLSILFIFISCASFGKSLKEHFVSLPEAFFEPYGLVNFSSKERTYLLHEKQVKLGDGNQVYFENSDSSENRLRIDYSKNFDENGFSLSFEFHDGILIVFQTEGDHCCDWTLAQDVYQLTKNGLFKTSSEYTFPELTWENFFSDLPDLKEFPFLKNAVPYYLSFNEKGIVATISWEYISLSYEEGNSFIDLYGKNVLIPTIIWDNNQLTLSSSDK